MLRGSSSLAGSGTRVPSSEIATGKGSTTPLRRFGSLGSPVSTRISPPSTRPPPTRCTAASVPPRAVHRHGPLQDIVGGPGTVAQPRIGDVDARHAAGDGNAAAVLRRVVDAVAAGGAAGHGDVDVARAVEQGLHLAPVVVGVRGVVREARERAIFCRPSSARCPRGPLRPPVGRTRSARQNGISGAARRTRGEARATERPGAEPFPAGFPYRAAPRKTAARHARIGGAPAFRTEFAVPGRRRIRSCRFRSSGSSPSSSTGRSRPS